jgi:carbon-monoxide dehydrogenase small subunit
MSSQHRIEVTVNGQRHQLAVEGRLTLADMLRHHLLLTGTHVGCEHGVCGACTVIVDGRTARSCLMLAVQVDGCSVETVESLSAPDQPLHPLQEAFRDNHALQCGFCTPGMLMTIVELLREGQELDDETVRERISGNICRCTGYQGIVKAALDTSRLMKTAGKP